MKQRARFWDLPNYSKLDILKPGEFNHTEILMQALADKETLVECIDRTTYTIYGSEESLLVEAVPPVFRMGMFIYHAVLSFIHK